MVPLFAGLQPEQIASLESMTQRRWFKRGEVIFHKGDPGDTLFVIVQGQVRIVLPAESGEEALLAVLDEGEFFGELALIDEEPRSATCIAAEATETLMLHRDAFARALGAHPGLAIHVLKILSRRLRDADEFVEDAIFLDVPGRLAKKLLQLAETYGRPGPRGTIIGLRLTQQELATMVGATRESVNKHLRAYRTRGILDIEHQHIIILKPTDLARRIY
jgi:CRP/FNR family transcriptional regulator/CRP/FNR family cyclic AMP-dependent transcriptional regulator